jgi:CBS domain-containing protein
MTAKVVVVSPDTPTNKISGLLLENGISAVPVVDGTGAPIGMVNEGDLLGCEEAARDDWWLALLADGAELNADNLANLRAPERTAREIMAASVVTVTEKTDISEIARLLAAYRIKRVPVVRDGGVIGVVSRADLLRGLAQEEPRPATLEAGATGHPIFQWLDKQLLQADRSEGEHPTAQPAAAASEEACASTFAAWSQAEPPPCAAFLAHDAALQMAERGACLMGCPGLRGSRISIR